jgi:Protein of unknown function (DUF3147)
MLVQLNFSALARVKWSEVAVRFLFGGAITATAGILANRFGPYLGGLFLAFPAIFPASVTLLAKKQEQKESRTRAKDASAVETRGTGSGAIGLVSFGLIVWLALQAGNSAVVLLLAALVWLCVAGVLWEASRKFRHWRRRRKNRARPSPTPARPAV